MGISPLEQMKGHRPMAGVQGHPRGVDSTPAETRATSDEARIEGDDDDGDRDVSTLLSALSGDAGETDHMSSGPADGTPMATASAGGTEVTAASGAGLSAHTTPVPDTGTALGALVTAGDSRGNTREALDIDTSDPTQATAQVQTEQANQQSARDELRHNAAGSRENLATLQGDRQAREQEHASLIDLSSAKRRDVAQSERAIDATQGQIESQSGQIEQIQKDGQDAADRTQQDDAAVESAQHQLEDAQQQADALQEKAEAAPATPPPAGNGKGAANGRPAQEQARQQQLQAQAAQARQREQQAQQRVDAATARKEQDQQRLEQDRERLERGLRTRHEAQQLQQGNRAALQGDVDGLKDVGRHAARTEELLEENHGRQQSQLRARDRSDANADAAERNLQQLTRVADGLKSQATTPTARPESDADATRRNPRLAQGQTTQQPQASATTGGRGPVHEVGPSVQEHGSRMRVSLVGLSSSGDERAGQSDGASGHARGRAGAGEDPGGAAIAASASSATTDSSPSSPGSSGPPGLAGKGGMPPGLAKKMG